MQNSVYESFLLTRTFLRKQSGKAERILPKFGLATGVLVHSRMREVFWSAANLRF